MMQGLQLWLSLHLRYWLVGTPVSDWTNQPPLFRHVPPPTERTVKESPWLYAKVTGTETAADAPLFVMVTSVRAISSSVNR